MTRQIFALVLLTASQLGGWTAEAQNEMATIDRRQAMTMHAKGTFVVKISPAEASPLAQEAGIGRMTIDKTFSGDFEGTSKGEMLTGGAESTGAMAYVALERVTGKLNGRSGSFLLMHNATMLKSDPSSGTMQVVVVPHSGTGELTGLTGKMIITIEGGKHSFDLDYQLP
jgi:Protein of unknown function (DUF3224)